MFPDGQATSEFLGWLSLYQLGRKRLLDTMLAATMQAAGVQRLITNNHRDFAVFSAFEIVTFHS